jgi:FKBP-type peptidyl-prolyl cis-trans isomerase FkpA
MRKAPMMKFFLATALVSSVALLACTKSGGKVNFKTENEKVSYIFGTQVGKSFKEFKDTGIELDTKIFMRAVNDVMEDKALALSDSEMAKVMEAFQTTMRTKQEENLKKDQADNLVKASQFLAENAAKPGVTTLSDSLEYQVITEGTGAQAKSGDTVRVHYVGTFMDGKEFDSSRNEGREPLEFQLGQPGMIQGFAEAVELMKVGSKWKVFIPPKLAYGEYGRPNIPPNSLLIFEIELIEIVPASAAKSK